ncbi:MAG: cupredoxin domain-containing protein [Acidimicrobiales bacterium]
MGRLVLATLVLLAGAAACADDGYGGGSIGGAPADACGTVDAGGLTLVARDSAWEPECADLVAGPLVIVVENEDDGINHNVHLPSAPGDPATELQVGPSRQELEVDLEPGVYEYVCDLHPDMVGTLTVVPANQE